MPAKAQAQRSMKSDSDPDSDIQKQKTHFHTKLGPNTQATACPSDHFTISGNSPMIVRLFFSDLKVPISKFNTLS
jgi:hypothetical protein